MKNTKKTISVPSYTSHFTQSELYCLDCGKQEVWVENDGEYVCASCKSFFVFNMFGTHQNSKTGEYIIAQLKEEAE